MLIHDIDESEFDSLLDGDIVLLDFYANWCGPCMMLSPILEEYSKKNNEVKILKIDVDKHPNLAKKYGVMTIPTLVLYKNKELVKKQIGFISLDMLEKWVSE